MNGLENNGSLREIFPIGYIYLSTSSIDPGTIFGGTWQQIKDRFLLTAGDTYSAGSIGGEATHTLTQAETPAHTHTRGTMNITGTLQCENRSVEDNGVYSGAFYRSTGSQTYMGIGDSDSDNPRLMFDASRSWKGETSSVGGNEAHNNMPPYLTVYAFERIA